MTMNQTQFTDHKEYLLVKCAEGASIEHKQQTLDQVVNFICKGHKNIVFDIRQSLLGMSDTDHLNCGGFIHERLKHLTDSKFAFIANPYEPVLFLSTAYAMGFNNFVEVHSESDALLWFSGEIH